MLHFCDVVQMFHFEDTGKGFSTINYMPLPNLQAQLQFTLDKKHDLIYILPESDPRFFEMPLELQQLAKQQLFYPFESAMMNMLCLQYFISLITHRSLRNPPAFAGLHTLIQHQTDLIQVPIGIPLIHGSPEYTKGDLSVKIQLLKQNEMKLFQQKLSKILPVAKDFLSNKELVEMAMSLLNENAAGLGTGNDMIQVVH